MNNHSDKKCPLHSSLLPLFHSVQRSSSRGDLLSRLKDCRWCLLIGPSHSILSCFLVGAYGLLVTLLFCTTTHFVTYILYIQYISDIWTEAGPAKIGLISDMARYPIILINQWDQKIGHKICLITVLAIYPNPITDMYCILLLLKVHASQATNYVNSSLRHGKRP